LAIRRADYYKQLPSWNRRGGCGIKKNERSHLNAAEDGVVAHTPF
jgi:hypothetical protein